jgi:hypothetical protein
MMKHLKMGKQYSSRNLLDDIKIIGGITIKRNSGNQNQ